MHALNGRCGRIVLWTILLALLSGAGPTAVPDSPPGLPNWPVPVVAPFLSAEDAIKRIKLPAGFRMEVVASEPLVEHPVAMSFDADGRAWVVEMRSYMPNVEGDGEKAPTGRISVLEDSDDDGRMDKVNRFMEGLVLPRAVLPVRGGALVAVPPKLMFCRDTDNDGKADEQTVITEDYGAGGNPEHQPNGLMPALDNWIYSAKYTKRLRYVAGQWVLDVIPMLGQWGITQDDFGRLFHNTNTDQLRGSIFPPHYAERNPHYRAAGANEQVAKSQAVWPAHPTAVDRGYLKTIMREDGTLKNFTSACAPVVYRGGIFPPEFNGNAFVLEPAANLIKRNVLVESDGAIDAKDAYAEGVEFLTSNYERFRPVNACVGPDGALYVVDMHHGLIQHKTYLTTYCKDQYLQRELEKHMGTGRIYRIVPETATRFPRPQLSSATTTQLVDTLAHPNGWWRDMAHRLLVERDDHHAIPLLRKVAAAHGNPLARLHALWTLEGLRISDPKVIVPALSDREPKIRAAAIRLVEPLLNSHIKETILPTFMKLADDPSPDVRIQFTLTASGLGTEEADAMLAKLLTDDASNRYVRDAAISGMRGRELGFLQRLLSTPGWETEQLGRDALIGSLTRAILTERSPRHVALLLETVAKQSDVVWRQHAMLDAMQPPAKAPKTRRRSIMLESEPTAFLALRESIDDNLAQKVTAALIAIHWPGEPGYAPPPPPPPLSPDEQARFDRGRGLYAMTCAACHQPSGQGQDGLAPPLVDSEWVLGPPSRLIGIVLHGLNGPVTVGGKTYNMDMPALPTMSDDDVAAVLTFVRRNWEHDASPVAPAAVAKMRAASRPTPWTERELLNLR
jgi:mono/diheme cytochrome c family protein/glucose/arabinose dehydrogenase